VTTAEYRLLLARQAARKKPPLTPITPTPPSRQTEAEIQADIESYLRGLGHTCWWTRSRMDIASSATRAGVPDFVGVYRGIGWAMEVKKPGGKETREQGGELLWFGLAGGRPAIVHSLGEAVNHMTAVAVSVPVAGREWIA